MEDEISSRSENAGVARIKDRIASLVDLRFATGAESYYLSQLGNELGPDRPLLEKLTRQKLSEFIRKEFDFEIGRAGQHQNVIYIVRQGNASSAVQAPKPATPRYKSRFWAAFAEPLPEDERRFIDIHTLAFGSDETALRDSGTDVREIGPEFIAPREASASTTEIADRIERWLQHQQLDQVPFLVQRRRASRDALPSLLEQLLDALDGEQLKRASLPLDIIRALSERRVR